MTSAVDKSLDRKSYGLASMGLAATSGFMLFVSDYPIHWYWLHFVALVPLLIAIQLPIKSRIVRNNLGFVFACSYAVPLFFAAGTAPPVIVAVVCGFIQWWIVVFVARWLLQSTKSLLSVAGWFCLVELFVWHVIPVFGAAQCFARVTSATPIMIQFAALTGMVGIVFALVWTQGLLAQAIYQRRPRPFVVLLIVVGCIGLMNAWRWNRALEKSVTVAAQGWQGPYSIDLREIRDAAEAAKADFLVTPETGFGLRIDSAEQDENGICNDLQGSGLCAAIGVFRADVRKNQILFIDDKGCVAQRYAKSHLIPMMENYNAGDGTLAIVNWKGVRCGGMICQDDNFLDLSRGYSRNGIQLMLVPTNDWAPIRGFHFESSVMRSIECGYGIVRATSGGISAIVSPRGEILKQHDHTITEGADLIAGDLPVGDGKPTLYARLGDWPIGILSFFSIVVSIAMRKKKHLGDRALTRTT